MFFRVGFPRTLALIYPHAYHVVPALTVATREPLSRIIQMAREHFPNKADEATLTIMEVF
jgi:hypothetical protein